MSEDADLARRAFDPDVLAGLEVMLGQLWAGGRIPDAAPPQRLRDGAATAAVAEHALTLAGLLAAGGTKAEVAEYIRSMEESRLGATHSAARDVNAVAREAWLLVRGVGEAFEGEE